MALPSIARHVQKHMRLFAVLESMDNGKPIRESRDADVPLVHWRFMYLWWFATYNSKTFIYYRLLVISTITLAGRS